MKLQKDLKTNCNDFLLKIVTSSSSFSFYGVGRQITDALMLSAISIKLA